VGGGRGATFALRILPQRRERHGLGREVWRLGTVHVLPPDGVWVAALRGHHKRVRVVGRRAERLAHRVGAAAGAIEPGRLATAFAQQGVWGPRPGGHFRPLTGQSVVIHGVDRL
jgi:hypothetical protein